MAILQMPSKAHPREIVQDGDLIPDNRLAAGAVDLLEHDAIARGVAEIAWTAEAPVNIALFGAWGSGKSSVYSMIEQHLARIAPRRVRVARYDAWKYGGRELKRNFIDSLGKELGLERKPEFSDGLETEQVDTKLNTGAWLVKNWRSLLIGLGLAITVAVLWVVVQAVATVVFTDEHFKTTAKSLIAQAGTVFGLALVAVLLGPKVFEGAVQTRRTPAPEGADQFANRFKQLVETALKGKAERLVVFIDELDRCDPKDVVATLIDLKTFLDQDNCVFIVAADREVIERALTDLPQAKPVREDEPYYATPGAFLDKIFQHQLALPPLRPRALTQFAQDLLRTQKGVWQELRDSDESGIDKFDRTVFALVPVHVRSPRRVKVLLNNFATNARIAESRGLDWLERAHELAVLTVLQTEFPSVAEDLRRVPRLLAYIRGEQDPTAIEAQHIVAKYIEPEVDPGWDEAEVDDVEETAAGRLLSDDKSKTGLLERHVAGERLRRHLANYLAKVTAAGIRDPRPDLLYLQSAAGREDLPDPRLGDVIDFAADTAPDTVVAAFAEQTSATLAVAIPLLVMEGDGAVGPGRAFAFESACRLVEGLDADDRAAVTAKVAPSLKAAANESSLPHPALPGALLVAAWDHDGEVVDDILRVAGRKGFPTAQLERLTIALPYLERTEWTLLVQLLAERFASYPEPLLLALREETAENASVLWRSVEDRVLEIINDLELPAPAAVAAPPATRAASAATPSQPEATGDGVVRLATIIDAVRGREDHEQVLSEVLVTFQAESAAEPLRVWVSDHADDLVGTMSSPLRRAFHSFVALEAYPDADITTWTALLPEYGEAAEELDFADQAPSEQAVEPEDVEGDERPTSEAPPANASGEGLVDISNVRAFATLAADGLLPKLLAAFATGGQSDLPGLHALAVKVAAWSSPSDETIVAPVSSALTSIGWTGGNTDDAAGQLLWTRKETLLAAINEIAQDDLSPAYQPFVDDLAAMLETFALTAFATTRWRAMCALLPAPAARDLSSRADEYPPAEGEAGVVLELRLAALASFGGPAPASSELLSLPEAQQGRGLTDAWLELKPDPSDTHDVLTAMPYSIKVLEDYCSAVSTSDRTQLWIALLAGNVSQNALSAAGAAGVGSAAIVAVRERVAHKTRDGERASLVTRLRLAKPDSADSTAVKKAACELAEDLLEKGSATDVRTAAELMIWAGGAAYGFTTSLREKFNAGVEKHGKALPQKTAAQLHDANLLTIPKKGFLSALLGR